LLEPWNGPQLGSGIRYSSDHLNQRRWRHYVPSKQW